MTCETCNRPLVRSGINARPVVYRSGIGYGCAWCAGPKQEAAPAEVAATEAEPDEADRIWNITRSMNCE